MKNHFIFILALSALGCSTDIAEVNAITDHEIFKQEEATMVTILYSDSADMKVRISANKMIRHLTNTNPRDEFPEGIFVEFLGNNGQVNSWLEADRATRYDKKNEVVAQGNAKFYNKKKETLTSTELIWDEDKSILRTNKFVQITQPMRGDTSYGYGFEANEEFTLFTIKNKASSILNAQSLKEKIDKGK
ncbi:MAG: LPS export ABC transporter protein LptC [Saprospiraceae bacterium]|jgi:LPS export ABC transporter protein LptC